PARTARGRRLSHTPTDSSGSASSKEGPLTRRYPIHDERASPQSRLPAEGRPAVKKPERPAGEAGSAIWAGAEQDFLAAAAASHASLHDPLTGLAGGALFLDRLGHALIRQRQAGPSIAVLVIDVDDPGALAGQLGPGGGDLA